jgi:hypothetical protein
VNQLQVLGYNTQLHYVILPTLNGVAYTDFIVAGIQQQMVNTDRDNFLLAQQWFLIRSSSHIEPVFSN